MICRERAPVARKRVVPLDKKELVAGFGSPADLPTDEPRPPAAQIWVTRMYHVADARNSQQDVVAAARKTKRPLPAPRLKLPWTVIDPPRYQRRTGIYI